MRSIYGRSRAMQGSRLTGSPVLSRRGTAPTRARTSCACSWHPIH